MKKITLALVALILLAACNNQQQSTLKEMDENNWVAEKKEQEQMVKQEKSWKTYQNTKFGFQFEYPSDSRLGDSPTSNVPDPEGHAIVFDHPQEPYGRFRIDVLTKEEALKGSSYYLNECIDLNTCVENNRRKIDEETTGLSDISLNGENARKEIISRPNSGNWKYYIHYIYKNNNLYIISLETNLNDEAKVLPTLNKILSTVEFKN